MPSKEIKINYYWPLEKENDSKKEIIVSLEPIFEKLKLMNRDNRVVKIDDGENIQLKDIQNEDGKWILCFLKNKSDSVFKSRLSEETKSAEPLEDDEFIGYECVVIYDCTTKLLAVQNNRNSIGANGVSVFIEKLCKKRISMSILTYADGYDEILSDDKVEYKSLVLGFTKLSELKKLATEEDDNIKKINEITSNIGALGGKIEFNVGRSRSTFLDKVGINNIVKTLKGFKGNTTLKLKIIQGDCVRTIDLISDKVCSTGIIFVSKEDPKTFDKIISTMQEKFEEALTNELEYCKKISDIIVV